MKTLFSSIISITLFSIAFSQNNLIHRIHKDSLVKKKEYYYYKDELYTGYAFTLFPTNQLKSEFEIKEGKVEGDFIEYHKEVNYEVKNYQDTILLSKLSDLLTQKEFELKCVSIKYQDIQGLNSELISKLGLKKLNKYLEAERSNNLKEKYIPILKKYKSIADSIDVYKLKMSKLNEIKIDILNKIEKESIKPKIQNNIFGKGQFKDNYQNSFWKYYNINGELIAAGNFLNGDQTDKNDNGIPRNGRIGNWKFFFDNGNIESEYNYKNGKLDGLFILWNKNGKKQQESIYKDGKLNGLTILYYENGNKQQESIYKDDILNGLTIFYNENGNKKKEVIFIDSKLNGLGIVFYENGNKKSELMFKNGNVNGLAILYNENGTKQGESMYKNGKANGLTILYYENGTKQQESMLKNDIEEGTFKTYYQNGSVKEIGVKSPLAKHQNNMIGDYFLYNEDGTLNKKLHINMDGSEIDITPKPFSTFSRSEANKAYKCYCCKSTIKGVYNGVTVNGYNASKIDVELLYDVYNSPKTKFESIADEFGDYSTPYEKLRKHYQFCTVKCSRICYY